MLEHQKRICAHLPDFALRAIGLLTEKSQQRLQMSHMR